MSVAPTSSQAQVARDLREVVRVLRDNSALARALADPAASADNEYRLIDNVFAPISPEAKQIIKQVVGRSWESTAQFMAWAEDTAVSQAWQWAKAEGVLLRCIDEVFEFGQMVARDHTVRAAITDRRVPVERRQELVHDLLAPTMAEPTIQLAMETVASRWGTIDDAVKASLNAGADLAGARLAVATVAKALPDDQKRRLGDALETRFGTAVIVEQTIDPAVLGGVRIECGADVIDSTMASRLEAVRRDFA